MTHENGRHKKIDEVCRLCSRRNSFLSGVQISVVDHHVDLAKVKPVLLKVDDPVDRLFASLNVFRIKSKEDTSAIPSLPHYKRPQRLVAIKAEDGIKRDAKRVQLPVSDI